MTPPPKEVRSGRVPTNIGLSLPKQAFPHSPSSPTPLPMSCFLLRKPYCQGSRARGRKTCTPKGPSVSPTGGRRPYGYGGASSQHPVRCCFSSQMCEHKEGNETFLRWLGREGEGEMRGQGHWWVWVVGEHWGLNPCHALLAL